MSHCTIAVSGQECTDTVTVGSLSHDDQNINSAGQTFILAGYTVPCSGTVVAWEFCYQILTVPSVTFYPGIWRVANTNGNGVVEYKLIRSSTVTYDPRGDPTNIFPCQIFNLSDTDQFIAPAESVVGLYSNVHTQLLRTNIDNSITTYQFMGNQSNTSNSVVNYNITIKMHLGKYSQLLYIAVH